MILDSGIDLNLRPLKYPIFYDMYKTGISNNWTVAEVSLDRDLVDLKYNLSDAEAHLVSRLVAYFATGDSIVSHNIALYLYRHVNSPEFRLFLSRQLFEESIHVDQYLLLVDAYIQDENERYEAFEAVKNIPSIKRKAEFAFKWMDSVKDIDELKTDEDKRKFLLVLVCFSACVEGLFFMGAFANVYFLRNKGLLPGLSEATDYIFRDESTHVAAAFELFNIIRNEQPNLFTEDLEKDIRMMISEAIECEVDFAEDALKWGVLGLKTEDMRTFLEYSADNRLTSLGYSKQYNVINPFDFMVLQDLGSLVNFFEKRVSDYDSVSTGTVCFDDDF